MAREDPFSEEKPGGERRENPSKAMEQNVFVGFFKKAHIYSPVKPT